MNITDKIKNRINSDQWIAAHKIDESRILVVRYLQGNTFPWAIHYYYPDDDCYERGVYSNNRTRAIKHFEYTLEGYLEDLRTSIFFLAKSFRSKDQLEKAKIELEEMTQDLVELARQIVPA